MPGPPRRILIVGDDPDVRSALVETLRAAGCDAVVPDPPRPHAAGKDGAAFRGEQVRDPALAARHCGGGLLQ